MGGEDANEEFEEAFVDRFNDDSQEMVVADVDKDDIVSQDDYEEQNNEVESVFDEDGNYKKVKESDLKEPNKAEAPMPTKKDLLKKQKQKSQ